MTKLSHLLSIETIRVKQSLSSKKKALEAISELFKLNHSHLDQDELLSQLIAREKLGSTGIGDGIAIPHCRNNQCTQPAAAIITLEQAVDFESIDQQPVDIIWALIVPTESNEEHLAILAKLAEILNQETHRKHLRQCQNQEALYNYICALDAESS